MAKAPYRSDEPCFKCDKKQKTVEVTLKDFKGVLCMDCLYEKIPSKPKKEEKKSDAHGEGSGGKAPTQPQQGVRVAG